MAKTKGGRPPILITGLSSFVKYPDDPEDKNVLTPRATEHVFIDRKDDPNYGFIGYMEEQSDGTYKFLSKSMELDQYIRNLELAGVFTNANAYALNKELSYLIFDLAQKTVRLNYKLTYPPIFRYYAIRNGSTFLTGRTGETSTTLIDMKLQDAQYGEGQVAVPELGSLLPDAEMIDGDNYIVEFYSSDLTLLSTESFHAKAAKMQSFDKTADMGVTGLRIFSPNIVNDEADAVYLFQDQNIGDFQYFVSVEYSDGLSRDVTHELGSGKLIIEGLDTIDTSVITPPEGEPQKFKLKYFLTPANSETPLSIEKEIKFYIRHDSLIDLITVLPVGYLPSEATETVNRYFGLFKPGKVIPIDGNIDDSSKKTLTIGSSVPVDVTLGLNLGVGGQTHQEFQYSMKLIQGPSSGYFVQMTKELNNFSQNHYRNLNYNPVTKLMGLVFDDIATLKSENAYNDNGTLIEPTHFRIRNLDGNHYFVQIKSIDAATLFSYDLGSSQIKPSEPLLVEFVKVTSSTEGGDTVERVTGIRAYYTTFTNELTQPA